MEILEAIGWFVLYLLAGVPFTAWLCHICRDNCAGPEDVLCVWLLWPCWLFMTLLVVFPVLVWWLLHRMAEDSLEAFADLIDAWDIS